MNVAGNITDAISEVDLLITQQANELSEMLHEHRLEMFPPDAQKHCARCKSPKSRSISASPPDI